MGRAVQVNGLVTYHEDSANAPPYETTDPSGTYVYPGATTGSAIEIAPSVFLSAFHVVYGPKTKNGHNYYYSSQTLSIGADLVLGTDPTTGHATKTLQGGDSVESFDNINNFQGAFGSPDLALFTTSGSQSASSDTDRQQVS